MSYFELLIICAPLIFLAFTAADILATKRVTGLWQVPPWLKAAWQWARSKVGK
jgi:hypothetical protein